MEGTGRDKGSWSLSSVTNKRHSTRSHQAEFANLGRVISGLSESVRQTDTIMAERDRHLKILMHEVLDQVSENETLRSREMQVIHDRTRAVHSMLLSTEEQKMMRRREEHSKWASAIRTALADEAADDTGDPDVDQQRRNRRASHRADARARTEELGGEMMRIDEAIMRSGFQRTSYPTPSSSSASSRASSPCSTASSSISSSRASSPFRPIESGALSPCSSPTELSPSDHYPTPSSSIASSRASSPCFSPSKVSPPGRESPRSPDSPSLWIPPLVLSPAAAAGSQVTIPGPLQDEVADHIVDNFTKAGGARTSEVQRLSQLLIGAGFAAAEKTMRGWMTRRLSTPKVDAKDTSGTISMDKWAQVRSYIASRASSKDAVTMAEMPAILQAAVSGTRNERGEGDATDGKISIAQMNRLVKELLVECTTSSKGQMNTQSRKQACADLLNMVSTVAGLESVVTRSHNPLDNAAKLKDVEPSLRMNVDATTIVVGLLDGEVRLLIVPWEHRNDVWKSLDNSKSLPKRFKILANLSSDGTSMWPVVIRKIKPAEIRGAGVGGVAAGETLTVYRDEEPDDDVESPGAQGGGSTGAGDGQDISDLLGAQRDQLRARVVENSAKIICIGVSCFHGCY